jgi:hypothetical protein
VNWMGIVGLILVVLCVGMIVGLVLISRKRPLPPLRPIPAISWLQRAIGQAVEGGSRLHVSLGSANLLTPQNVSALIGLAVLKQVARLGINSDQAPIATSGESNLAILSQDVLRSAAQDAHSPEQYDPGLGRLTGLTPFSYAVGAISTVTSEQASANILLGNFGPEVVYLTDAAERSQSFSLGGSDALAGQAVLYATVEAPLIGEELFASSAHICAGQSHIASLHVQDVLRWGLAAVLVGGAILKLVGIL